MGREIRRVPPNWEHPKSETRDGLQSMHDRTCEDAWSEWMTGYTEWQAGEHDRVIAEYGEADYPKDRPYTAYCSWGGEPPCPTYYRPAWKHGEDTWYQVYETVSEGTPVTPPFATQKELIDYLVENGDFWDQRRRSDGCTAMNCDPWPREQAEKFVLGPGWAPSFVQDSKGFRSGVEALTDEPLPNKVKNPC